MLGARGGDVVPVARVNVEASRAIKPYGQIGGLKGPKILQL